MISLIFQRARTSIDILELDACESQQHDVNLDVTEHPVEEGSDITDHSRRKPDEVTIVGSVSNAPVGGAGLSAGAVTQAAADGGSFDASGDPELSAALAANDARSDTAYATLLRIADDRKPVTVSTTLRVYESMLLDKLSVPRDARTGATLRFSAHFRQVKFATSQVVQVSLPKARAKKRDGKKATTKATTEDPPAKSLLLKLKQGVSGWFQ